MSNSKEDLERQIATCTNAEELKVLTRELMEVTGASNHFAEPTVSAPQTTEPIILNGVDLAHSGYTMERRIYLAGQPPMVARANTKADLDRLEAEAMFGNR